MCKMESEASNCCQGAIDDLQRRLSQIDCGYITGPSATKASHHAGLQSIGSRAFPSTFTPICICVSKVSSTIYRERTNPLMPRCLKFCGNVRSAGTQQADPLFARTGDTPVTADWPASEPWRVQEHFFTVRYFSRCIWIGTGRGAEMVWSMEHALVDRIF